MNKTRIIYYPVPFIVLHPLIPVALYTVLPGHIVKVTGIRAVHSVGIEHMTDDTYLPVTGHLSLEFNNRQYHFGHLDIAFDNQPASSDAYLDVQIDVQRNSLMTGCYENKVFTGTEHVRPDHTLTDKWHNYIVTIYLKALSND